jgi:hypothetical protein
MSLSKIRRCVRDESGFTMVVVMGVLLVATLFSVAAIAAAQHDIKPSRLDVDRKQAWAAAEAGINDYMARLNQDANYWTKCTNVQAPAPVNQRFTRTSAGEPDPRSWRFIPGSTEADYTIELIPVNGYTVCDPTKPEESMIDTNTGAFTIRATGRSRAAGVGDAVTRSIVVKFRRRGFLDFLWFTDLETLHPDFFTGSQYTAAFSQCQVYKRNGRPSGYPCADLTFIDPDVVAGPLHTNDRLLVQGHPDFGRTKADDIEIVAADGGGPPTGPAWEPNGSGDPAPWNGTYRPAAAPMDMPPSNQELANVAGWVFTGDTELRFSGTQVTVVNKAVDPSGTLVKNMTDADFNGVIYVKSNGGTICGTRQNPYPSPKDEGCANLWVSGTYSKSVTLASEGDVIVKASDDLSSGANGKGLRRVGDVFAGLVANNWVRVEHRCNTSSDTNVTPGTELNVQIDAAILSLNRSFTVDNYTCGARLDTLTVNGAIAQKFRGPVGQFGYINHGYTKNYVYDNRLRFRSPPYFLDPIQSAWRTVSYTEQVPATK